MKLQFKEQQFQLDAVKAVVDCFAGQKLKTNHFTLEKSKELINKAKQAKSAQQALEFEAEVYETIGYINSKVQVTNAQLLKNIQEVQSRNDILESPELAFPKGHKGGGCHLTIEMETGTGKTYTYIRTMYELHKHYGWSKFIVVVPSIAIREGVKKSFDVTQEHFQEVFGHKISPFIYSSSSPQDIETFASDSRISVMIINTQAFSRRGKDALRIFQELDQFGSRKPIEIIAQTNPILIIDEPQSVDGPVALQMMKEFNPLFSLRYSATHKEEYNKIYRLDALDAYHQKLVKKIQVKGINLKGSTGVTGYLYLEHIELSTTKPPLAVVEFEQRTKSGKLRRVRMKLEQGANLYELSGNMPAYLHQVISEVNGQLNRIIVGGEEIYAGDVINDKDEMAFRRIQIRETIMSHLEKEKQYYDMGIKVLTLFFIDSVEKYRKYDETGEQVLGDYAKIFEEEYVNAISEFLDLFKQDYNKYMNESDPRKVHKVYSPEQRQAYNAESKEAYWLRDKPEQVHQGYFAIDKKGKTIDPKVGRGKEDSDDVSAYDLIMKDKERLLSFDEPVRFIFSHSALKEGWDNPNVFQICALKNVDSGSQTRRRQEVGRGMRLCVNNHGNRLDFDAVGDQVQEINKLTVVASESYEQFAKGLQNEIASTLKERPQKAEIKYFIGKLVRNEKGEEHRITEEQAQKLQFKLIVDQIIDEDLKVTRIGREKIESNKINLPEALEPYRASVCGLMKAIYSGGEFMAKNERDTSPISTNKNFAKAEFQALWEKINIKTIYEVQFDSEKLVKDAIKKIDDELKIGDRTYIIKTGVLKDSSKEEMESGDAIQTTKVENKKQNSDIYADTVYDIVGEIEKLSYLTRRSIAAILSGIKIDRFALIKKNPEEFISKASRLINEVKASLIINNIKYSKIDECFDSKTVFSNDKMAMRNSEPLKKHIYDFLISDSKIEEEFAKHLETCTDVVVYAKLPKAFHITTPIANYNPDWAIVLDKEKVREIYFVTETKGSESEDNLRAVEKLKIHCADEHFKEISDGTVKFNKVKDYAGLMDLIEYK